MQMSYWYLARIMRAGLQVTKQGSVFADDELDASDKVYEKGRTEWHRVVFEVTIFGTNTGEVLATSKIADKVQQNLALPAPKEEPERRPAGFNRDWQSSYWGVTEFGTYYNEPKFARIVDFK